MRIQQRAFYDGNYAKTQEFVDLRKGDLFGLFVWPIGLVDPPVILPAMQYQKGICFFVGLSGCVCAEILARTLAAADELLKL